MTEKEHDKTTASTSENLRGEFADSGESLDAYLAAVLSPLGGEHKITGHAGNIDYLDSATVNQEPDIECNAFGREASNINLTSTEFGEKSLYELILLDCIEGKHQVSRNSLDSHGNGSYPSGDTANRITAIAQAFMCGAVGAAIVLIIEKLAS